MNTMLLVNGPNLGILGRREPEIYGTATNADIEAAVADEVAGVGWKVRSVQSDAEGELIRALHAAGDTVGAVVNPGALMIAGWSLRDALASYPRPWIEVHLSNVWARESFRHESVLAPLAAGIVVGLGPYGYRLAARALVHRVMEAEEAARAASSAHGATTPPAETARTAPAHAWTAPATG